MDPTIPVSKVEVAQSIQYGHRPLTAGSYEVPTVVDNPSLPQVFMTLVREGEESEPFEIHPLQMEFIQSVKAADMLKITLLDPDLFFIDHPMLQEDLKTTVRLRFGYSNRMSEEGILVFFRQAPDFPESGPITTTLTFFDKGIYLMMPSEARKFESESEMNGKDIIEQIIQDVNERWDAGLEAVYDEHEFENLPFRIHKTEGTTGMEFLYWVREGLRTKGGRDQSLVEIYVQDNKLHVHPPRKTKKALGVFKYFSAVPGERLLSFQPKVNLHPRKKKAAGVDTDTGETVSAEESNRTAPNRPVLANVSIDADTMVDTLHLVAKGDRRGTSGTSTPIQTVKHRYRAGKDTIESIAAKYGSTPDAILAENGLDPENLHLAPDQELEVPVLREEGTGALTTEARHFAAGYYLFDEGEAVKADAMILGDPRIRAGWPVVFRGVGKKWEGQWYILEAIHTIDTSGYKTRLDCVREGLLIGEGLDALTSSDKPPIEVMDAAEQERKERRAVRVDADTLQDTRPEQWDLR